MARKLLQSPLSASYRARACRLLANGDRAPPPFDVWGFGLVDGRCDFVNYGQYDVEVGKMVWNKTALAADGLTPKLVE